MASRILSVAIVCFWLVMTTLLVQLENHPDRSDLLSLPYQKVIQIMFMHQQISDLTITQDGKAVGNLMLHPKTDPDGNKRSLVFSGGFSFLPTGAQRKEHISWDGEVDMDHSFELLGMSLTTSFQDPPYHVHIDLDPAKKQVNYQLSLGTRQVKHASIPLNQEGVNALLRDELGIDPSMLQTMPVSLSAPVISAKQTELKIRKENVAAYLLTIKTGETTLAEIYVSQLGQVLTAKTLVGYNLTTEDLSPP